MRLYFIRHGQSENNALWDQTGDNIGRKQDPELTEIGKEQARRLGEFIRMKDCEAPGDEKGTQRDLFRFTHLYTSLMVRSVRTATAVARSTGLTLHAWPEIHECGGIFMDDEETGLPVGQPGNPRSYFVENFAHLVLPDTVTEEGWWNRPFEAREDRPLRARKVFESLLEKHDGTDDHVAFVSHGAFYMELMRVLLQIEDRNNWFLMNNTGISRFDFHSNGEVTIVYHNRTDHLPEELIT